MIECHAPVWERQRDKTGRFLSPFRLAGVAGSLAASWVRLARAQTRVGVVDAVVVGYPSQPDAVLGWVVARARRAPLILDAMFPVSDAFADRGIGRLSVGLLAVLDRLAFGRAHLLVADTGANARWLEERFGLPEGRVVSVPVGADPDVFASAAAAPRMGHALFVGKLAPLHGLDVVLAAARSPGAPPLRIIGTGQLGDWLAAELVRDPPPGVSHVPWVPFARLGDELRAASVCLGVFSSSARAGRVIPNKVWQAMAVGRPIVTADGPAAREVLHDGRDALLVPPGDPGALADALERLAADPELRVRLGTAARRRYVALGAPPRVAARFLAGIGPVVPLRPPGPA